MISNIAEKNGTLDKVAVTTSFLCALHCFSLPIVLGLFPAIGSSFLGQELFHEALLFLVIPVSLVSLSLGCKKHKSKLVVGLGLVGLMLLTFAAIWGHDLLGENGERYMTVLGAVAIAAGHMRNYKLCRQVKCAH